ncbi:YceI family protein [Tenacibaculum sp. 190524A02b]|uniref:YceI family protein n=1 Tax=Tenacibaculum vairaonense TaxID=3137860 RepID=A0ABP1FDU0_9FLAO
MKKSILAIAFVALGVVSCKTDKKKVEAKEEVKEVKKVENVINSYKANITESTLTWKGTKPTGSHTGTISLEKGLLDIENGNVKAGRFLVNMSSIVCTDLEAGKGKEDLEGHLKAPDFFDVEKYPTAKFEVTSSEVKDGKVNITGNLTIKDVTKSITIPATISEKDGSLSFKSDFSIDRTEFGIQYKSKKFFDNLKDKFINDLIEFSFDIKAIK